MKEGGQGVLWVYVADDKKSVVLYFPALLIACVTEGKIKCNDNG